MMRRAFGAFMRGDKRVARLFPDFKALRSTTTGRPEFSHHAPDHDPASHRRQHPGFRPISPTPSTRPSRSPISGCAIRASCRKPEYQRRRGAGRNLGRSWAYGLGAANRRSATAIRYTHEQGLTGSLGVHRRCLRSDRDGILSGVGGYRGYRLIRLIFAPSTSSYMSPLVSRIMPTTGLVMFSNRLKRWRPLYDATEPSTPTFRPWARRKSASAPKAR